MAIVRVKSDTIAIFSLPAEADETFTAGQLVTYDANGVEVASTGTVVGMVLEDKSDSANPNPDGYGMTEVTVIRGAGLMSTDQYTGEVAVGDLMVIDTDTNLMTTDNTPGSAVIAIALGAGTGGTDEVDFLLTGDM